MDATDVDSSNGRLRVELATACRVLAAAGAGDLIWGHASIRDPTGRGVWLKQAGFGLEEITAERVHLVARDGSVLAGGGQRHSEYPIHTEIMSAREDVNAVVHVHSRYAVALAASGVELMSISHEANFFLPPAVPTYSRTADLIMTSALGQEIAEALTDAPAMFLVNHGLVTVGTDIQTATMAAVFLDRACHQQLLTLGYGSIGRTSSPTESLAKREHIYSDAAIHQAYDYLVRTLPAQG